MPLKNLENVQFNIQKNLEKVRVWYYNFLEKVQNMKRKIYEDFIQWKKNDARECALMVDGARRIGKSYIIEEFAKNEYESYILIDFNLVGDDVKSLFELYLNDLDTFFMMLSTIYGVKLIEGKSLIIFDEVQLFPKARAAIKYLVKDNRYDYIETGSLISIRKNVKDC